MGSHEHPVLRNQLEGQGADSGEEHHRQPYASPVGVALLVFPGFDSAGDKVRLGWLEKNTSLTLNPSASVRSLYSSQDQGAGTWNRRLCLLSSFEMPVYFLRLFQERLALRESKHPKELIWILCEE